MSLHVTIDPRDGGMSNLGGSCAKCCCEPIRMRPGETNLMTLNYAPWSVPLGFPGIVPTPFFDIQVDNSACATGMVDGQPPMAISFAPQNFTAPVATATVLDLAPYVTPIGNIAKWEVIPLTGPLHGSILPAPGGVSTSGEFTYTGAGGFNGWDEFWVKITDNQGREINQLVRVKVGSPAGPAPSLIITNLVIPPASVQVNQQTQQVSFALELTSGARLCESFKVTVKQPARDCERTFFHITCFEVFPAKC